ncbi:Merozoite surface protein 1, partial [Frankliniella fusca]
WKRRKRVSASTSERGTVSWAVAAAPASPASTISGSCGGGGAAAAGAAPGPRPGPGPGESTEYSEDGTSTMSTRCSDSATTAPNTSTRAITFTAIFTSLSVVRVHHEVVVGDVAPHVGCAGQGSAGQGQAVEGRVGYKEASPPRIEDHQMRGAEPNGDVTVTMATMASAKSRSCCFPALLLLLAVVVAAASALPVSSENDATVPEGEVARARPGLSLLLPLPAAGLESVPAGALLACNTQACYQRCRSHWSRGGSCQRGLCICV